MAAKMIQVMGEVAPTEKNPLGIGLISLDTIAGTPIARYLQYQDRIVNARDQVYYDTLRLAGGTPWTSSQTARLFTIGVEKSGTLANSGTAITKTYYDTNMTADGEFPYGVTVIVHAIEVDICLTARQGTDNNGIISDPAPLAESSNTYSATLLMRALLRQTRLVFRRGDRDEESGLLYQFPCRFGMSGVFGGDTDEGFVQNTIFGGSMLNFPKVLQPDEDFHVKIEPLAPSLALPADVALTVLLHTKRIGEVG